jgi:hypothetical protein
MNTKTRALRGHRRTNGRQILTAIGPQRAIITGDDAGRFARGRYQHAVCFVKINVLSVLGIDKSATVFGRRLIGLAVASLAWYTGIDPTVLQSGIVQFGLRIANEAVSRQSI